MNNHLFIHNSRTRIIVQHFISESHALILCEGLAAIGSENHIYIRDIIPNILSLLQSSAICQQGQVKVSLSIIVLVNVVVKL